MSKSERERRHHASVERINQVQLVTGTGDGTRVDHEGTVLERARMLCEELSSHQATERGLAAFERLLRVAQGGDSPRSRDVVQFLTAVANQAPLPLATLRGHPSPIGDDMLAVLDAFRYARLELLEQVEGGARRVWRILGSKSAAKA